MEKLQRCGIIKRTVGLKGDVILELDNFNGMFEPGEEVYLGFTPQFSVKKIISNCKMHGKNFQISFVGYNTKELAETLIGNAVFADAEKRTGKYSEEYLVDDIMGSQVFDHKDKTLIGAVTDVWQLPANDVWVITKVDNTELLLPVIEDTVKEIHVSEKRIFVTVMEEIEGDE